MWNALICKHWLDGQWIKSKVYACGLIIFKLNVCLGRVLGRVLGREKWGGQVTLHAICYMSFVLTLSYCFFCLTCMINSNSITTVNCKSLHFVTFNYNHISTNYYALHFYNSKHISLLLQSYHLVLILHHQYVPPISIMLLKSILLLHALILFHQQIHTQIDQVHFLLHQPPFHRQIASKCWKHPKKQKTLHQNINTNCTINHFLLVKWQGYSVPKRKKT